MTEKDFLNYYVSEFLYKESSEESRNISITIENRVTAYVKTTNFDECDKFLLVSESEGSNKENPDDSFHIRLVVKFECSCESRQLSKELIKDEYYPYAESITKHILKQLTSDMKINPLDLI